MTAPVIRFAPLAGGGRVAFHVLGTGPAVAMLYPYHVNHLALNWRVPLHRGATQFLARHGTVINLDFPGAGLSDRIDRELTLASMSEALDAVRKAVDIDRLGLCAMGAAGLIACEFAGRHPEHVTRLVLVASGESDANRQLLQLRNSAPELEPEIRGALLGGVGDRHNARALAEVARAALDAPALAGWQSLLDREEVLAVAARVSAPVLYFHASGDRLVPLAAAEALVGRLAHATLRIVPGRSGMDAWRHRPAVAEIAEFLAGEPGATATPVRSRRRSIAARDAGGLSERQAEVMRLVAAGRTNQQIADDLFISLNTVSYHLRNIFAITGATNRTEAAALIFGRSSKPAVS